MIPEDYHALYDRGVQAARSAEQPAAEMPTTGREQLSADVPDLIIEEDETTGLPNRVISRRPDGRLSEPGPPDPADAARQFIQDRRAVWNLAEDDASAVQVRSVSRTGLKTAQLYQSVDGVEVFDSDMTVALDDGNQVISLAGQFFPGAGAAARESRESRAAQARTPEDSIARAAFDLTRLVYQAADFGPAETQPDDGPYRLYEFKSGDNDPRPRFERQVRVKDVMFPVGNQQFAAGHYIELWIAGFPAFGYVIDAVETPFVLFRKNLTSESAPFTYRVHNTGDTLFRPHDGPAPGSPHPTGTPDGFQADPVQERLVTLESLPGHDPWLPPGATTTRGNNCVAYADLQGPTGLGAGDVLGKITAPETFDYTYDHGKNASDATNLQNSLVGMFFHVNWLHDRWYEAGFDEGAGNAQTDNFGRGGTGGDPVLAEGNDFSGTDNANMSTPADGASPRMQMYEFLGPQPDKPTRTSNHEALITFHEMGHYITNRLVGNSTGLTNQQGRAMGEGWGDFFAISMTSQPADDFTDGAFPVGGWTDLTPTFNDNYYYSIRRYPYSADTAKNPLTFRHISAGQLLPVGPPISPNAGGPNSAVHNAGEIWCAALWEVFVNLVAKHGHGEAERLVLLDVVGGLKLTPSRPTFLQARDGIISAAAALNPDDLPDIWAGFAKRGMGVGAVAPAQNSTDLTGVTESFDPPES
ncbi:extracellular elastinolytic metalloproteinase [Pseudarthrobacter defluvii]|uniref:M36 family metallopeptidase n=1 Tax=Pseudarthrobacter defluvii TaxID=410837 RepID=UPI00277D4DC9|nr:M36 family metallopeptidase [Pseudarthrobacter defluvii]MDQ0767943.1 extracellular elastinolytic metalloproteinase [Pseudarthrobacter defluvii]